MTVSIDTIEYILSRCAPAIIYIYEANNPVKDIYGRLLPQSNIVYLSEIYPYIGFMHHGNAIIPYDIAIEIGELCNFSMKTNCIAIDGKDTTKPIVK